MLVCIYSDTSSRHHVHAFTFLSEPHSGLVNDILGVHSLRLAQANHLKARICLLFAAMANDLAALELFVGRKGFYVSDLEKRYLFVYVY